MHHHVVIMISNPLNVNISHIRGWVRYIRNYTTVRTNLWWSHILSSIVYETCNIPLIYWMPAVWPCRVSTHGYAYVSVNYYAKNKMSDNHLFVLRLYRIILGESIGTLKVVWRSIASSRFHPEFVNHYVHNACMLHRFATGWLLRSSSWWSPMILTMICCLINPRLLSETDSPQTFVQGHNQINVCNILTHLRGTEKGTIVKAIIHPVGCVVQSFHITTKLRSYTCRFSYRTCLPSSG